MSPLRFLTFLYFILWNYENSYCLILTKISDYYVTGILGLLHHKQHSLTFLKFPDKHN